MKQPSIPNFRATEAQSVSSTARPILWAGLIVGILDGLAATLEAYFRGVKPIVVFQYVASGILGSNSFKGGLLTYAIGFLLHFVVAFGTSAVFVGLGKLFPFFIRMPLISGPVFGVFVHFFMSQVVSPLSMVPKLPTTVSGTLTMLLIHVFCVGLPIALIARRFQNPRQLEI